MDDRICAYPGCTNLGELGVYRRLKYCGDVCRERDKWRKRKPGTREGVGRLPCAVCGEPIGPDPYKPYRGGVKHNRCFEHGTEYGYTKHGCRCRACTDANTIQGREYEARVREREGVSPSAAAKRRRKGQPSESRICIGCGEPVSQSRTDADYLPCHKKCRPLVPNWKRRGEESPRVRAFRKLIDEAAKGRSGGKRVWVQGPCAWCGAPFLAAGGAYCSDTCKGAAKLHRHLSERGRFSVTPEERLAVYVRDRWTCQLCFSPVLQGIDPLDAGAPTLDHVVPQSKGGSHSLDNLQLAHRRCNSVRRDLDVEEARCLLQN